MPAEVWVIGEALVDVVRSSAGVERLVGGSPANVALGLGRLGRSVALVTQLGADSDGRLIRTHLEASSVQVWATPLESTSTATAALHPDGRAEYDFDVVWGAFELPDEPFPNVVHTGSIAAFLEPGATALRSVIERLGRVCHVTFDPNIRSAVLPDELEVRKAFERAISVCTLVKLSDEDARFLYPNKSAEEVIARVLGLGPRLAVLTLGAAGALLGTSGVRIQIEAARVPVSDTIGAGDTIMASLIHSLLDGPLDDERAIFAAAQEAARRAAITVSRPGADLPWRDE